MGKQNEMKWINEWEAYWFLSYQNVLTYVSNVEGYFHCTRYRVSRQYCRHGQICLLNQTRPKLSLCMLKHWNRLKWGYNFDSLSSVSKFLFQQLSGPMLLVKDDQFSLQSFLLSWNCSSSSRASWNTSCMFFPDLETILCFHIWDK